jgi:hypothetical protein
VEKTDTFCRAIGQTTDIIEKERPLHKYESSSKRHFSPT